MSTCSSPTIISPLFPPIQSLQALYDSHYLECPRKPNLLPVCLLICWFFWFFCWRSKDIDRNTHYHYCNFSTIDSESILCIMAKQNSYKTPHIWACYAGKAGEDIAQAAQAIVDGLRLLETLCIGGSAAAIKALRPHNIAEVECSLHGDATLLVAAAQLQHETADVAEWLDRCLK